MSGAAADISYEESSADSESSSESNQADAAWPEGREPRHADVIGTQDSVRSGASIEYDREVPYKSIPGLEVVSDDAVEDGADWDSLFADAFPPTPTQRTGAAVSDTEPTPKKQKIAAKPEQRDTDDDEADEEGGDVDDDPPGVADEDAEPQKKKTRKVYFWTVSGPGAAKFMKQHPDYRARFGQALVDAYNKSNPQAGVQYYAVFVEPGQVGTRTPEKHLHAVVLTKKSIKFVGVANALRVAGLYGHASVTHDGYYSGFRYCWRPSVKKTLRDLDAEPFFSENHPSAEDAQRAPRTSAATKGRKAGAATGKGAEKPPKPPRFSLPALKALVRREKITSVAELMLRATRIPELADFCLARRRELRGYLSTVWEIEGAKATVERSSKSLVDILEDARSKPCVCDGAWTEVAEDICTRQGIDKTTFCTAIYTSLEIGNKKGSNVFIYGPTNSGKTFLVAPLEDIYATFVRWEKKATKPFENLPCCELILLQDFRYNPDGAVGWEDLLVVFEGGVVSCDVKGGAGVKHRVKQPVVLTSKEKMYHTDEREFDQMLKRFKFFETKFTIADGDKRLVDDCAACFAGFIIANKAAAGPQFCAVGASPAERPREQGRVAFCPACGGPVTPGSVGVLQRVRGAVALLG